MYITMKNNTGLAIILTVIVSFMVHLFLGHIPVPSAFEHIFFAIGRILPSIIIILIIPSLVTLLAYMYSEKWQHNTYLTITLVVMLIFFWVIIRGALHWRSLEGYLGSHVA